MAQYGLAITAIASASGKTLITLGLLAALKAKGVSICSAKSGPDYIDPGFHAAALGMGGINLDGFAMSPDLIRHLAANHEGDTLIIEGAMGVADGGKGSTAALAATLGVPVILVMDVRGQAETAAMLAHGIDHMLGQNHNGTRLAGVILNRCRSDRHAAIITTAMTDQDIPVLGVMTDDDQLAIPSRHLGLVQASELNQSGDLDDIIARLKTQIESQIDLDRLIALAAPILPPTGLEIVAMPPPAQRIAVAMDQAFAFSYRHLLDGWRKAGAEILPFSPLADEGPDQKADMVYLPGGYPELYLDVLAAGKIWQAGISAMAEHRRPVFGECGGYMVLGQEIISAKGKRVPMTGLLDVVTSFAETRLQLGYRKLERLADVPLPEIAYGHEFHYTTTIREQGQPLFAASDKDGKTLASMGVVNGSVFGSYAHLIAAT